MELMMSNGLSFSLVFQNLSHRGWRESGWKGHNSSTGDTEAL